MKTTTDKRDLFENYNRKMYAFNANQIATSVDSSVSHSTPTYLFRL